VENYGRVGEAADNTRHAHCMQDNYGYKHKFIICNTYSFPLQQWLSKCASCVMYINTHTMPVSFIFGGVSLSLHSYKGIAHEDE
jgi:hypothetical protein